MESPTHADPTTGWRDAFHRRPMLSGLLLFGSGISFHKFLPTLPIVWLVTVAVLLGLAWWVHRCAWSSVLLIIAIFVAGLALAQRSAFYWPGDDISLYSTDEPRLAQVEMTIVAEPRTLMGPPDAPWPMPPRQVTTGRIDRVMTWDGFADTSGEVLVQIQQPHPRLELGQTIRAIGMLQRPAPASNPGQFDWASYYRRQRVLASFTIPTADNISILTPGDPGPLDHLRRAVRRLLAMGFEPNQSIDHALLRALLVGDRDPELRDIQDQFKRTGTSHHLAISGLHIAILGGVVYGICRLARISPRITALITLAFVVTYGLVALPSPPVVRSVLLCAAFVIGVTSRRMVDGVQLLCLTAIGMLVYHPLDLFDPGFQLSFGTVLGLMMLTPSFSRLVYRLRDPDTALAPKSPGAFATAGRWADGQLVALLASSVVAWVISMPLIAWHFGQPKCR